VSQKRKTWRNRALKCGKGTSVAKISRLKKSRTRNRHEDSNKKYDIEQK
jgi:hypothetical protein